MSKNSEKRKNAYKDSVLTAIFDRKIREAFIGEPCPVCGTIMKLYTEGGISTRYFMPSIQHNKPLSMGGKHELRNISVICHKCNITLKDKETDNLNNSKVIEVWQSISGIPLVYPYTVYPV